MNWLALLGLEGWLARWRGCVTEAASAAEDRMQLACLEWQDFKRHLQQLLLLTVVMVALTVVMLIMLSLAVLVQFWDSPERTLVACLLAGLWVVAWAYGALLLLRKARCAGHGLALTRRELAQDWRDIKERL